MKENEFICIDNCDCEECSIYCFQFGLCGYCEYMDQNPICENCVFFPLDKEKQDSE